jgi:hypothetical protein
MSQVNTAAHIRVAKKIMQIVRVAGLVSRLAGLAALSACATFVAYPGAEREGSEVAVVEGYTRNYLLFLAEGKITAVDGVRPPNILQSAYVSSLLPGRHWIEITDERYFGGSHGITVCAVDLDLEAGHRYQLEADSIESETSWLRRAPGAPYAGSMAFRVTAPGVTDDVQTRKATCVDGGGSFCRQVSDCAPHPDMRCLPLRGAGFGMCGFDPP